MAAMRGERASGRKPLPSMRSWHVRHAFPRATGPDCRRRSKGESAGKRSANTFIDFSIKMCSQVRRFSLRCETSCQVPQELGSQRDVRQRSPSSGPQRAEPATHTAEPVGLPVCDLTLRHRNRAVNTQNAKSRSNLKTLNETDLPAGKS